MKAYRSVFSYYNIDSIHRKKREEREIHRHNAYCSQIHQNDKIAQKNILSYTIINNIGLEWLHFFLNIAHDYTKALYLFIAYSLGGGKNPKTQSGNSTRHA